MLKREHIKQAIDAIAAREAEIGYSLAELFGTGRIDIPAPRERMSEGSAFYFMFDNQPVAVGKDNFFNEGLAAIEQPLLVRYGEMEKKQSLASANGTFDFAKAYPTIRRAGLSLLLRYEARLAIERLNEEARGGNPGAAAAEARDLLAQLRPEGPCAALPRRADDPRVLFTGAVDADTPAFFLPFLYTADSLMQVADAELPFFSLRFLLSCLCSGTAGNLFACVVNGAVAGLVYLNEQRAFFSKSLEIKYIASARRKPYRQGENVPLHRGVGTFLVAGVWLMWKNHRPDVREIVLDSEIEAAAFYESIGFTKRRPYVYVLGRPAGYLMNALGVMADRSRNAQNGAVKELARLVGHQARFAAHSRPDDPRREQALHFLKLCLLSRSRPDLAKAAALNLLKHKRHIAEAESLLGTGIEHGRLRLVEPARGASQLLVFHDARMQSHLQGIFHLESAHRIKALETILQEPPLAGSWIAVPGRRAEEEELAWVHTAEHIARLRSTSGKRLTSIDLDTQTTPTSYDTARLAVGGVFSLLDAICEGRERRGFAAVRPPGHHAEPNRAMGFCLLNNAALGARYLMHARGLKRIMIIDIDAHHGNGTQAAFFGSREVLYLSLHQFPCYPGSGNFSEIGCGQGEGYSVNVPLDKGMGDKEFVQVLHHLADPLACAYEPEMILVSCGFDLYRHDRLAGLNGTPAGYAMLTRQLCRMADKICAGRIAFIMEGGYSVEGIRECGLRMFQELCDLPGTTGPPDDLASGSPFASLRKTITLHGRYWSILR